MISVLPFDDRGAATGRPRELPELEALQTIMAGKATLHPRQDEPPWLILNEANKSLAALDRIGPPMTSEALERFSSELLPSGVRQTILQGEHISWTRSSSKGEVAFRKALLGPVGPVPGLSRQISGTLAYQLEQKRLVTLDHAPSEEEIETLGIIGLPDREDVRWSGEWRCYAIDPKWSAFCTACRVFSGELDRALLRALREGRMLIVEELFPGARLLHPDRWKEEQYDPVNYINDWVVLTRDLPSEWIRSRPKKLGRPAGRGGFAAKDKPFVDLVLEELERNSDATVHGAVVDVLDQYGDEISGASYDAKKRRLMSRVQEARE